MRIVALQNCAVEGLGSYEAELRARSARAGSFTLVHTYQEHSQLSAVLPEMDTVDVLVVGGTPISAYEADAHPFLREEVVYIEEALAAGIRCLGICCGAQLIAQILGATVRRNPVMEIGGYEVSLTAAGERSPLLRDFPGRFPVFHWHGDTFDIPEGAQHLVEGDLCRNQMFRLGNAVGVQFHLETSADEAAIWAAAYPQELECVAKTPEQVVGECGQREARRRTLAARLVSNFLDDPAR